MQDRDEASLLLFLAPLLILLALPLCAEECATVCYHFQLPMAALRGKNFIILALCIAWTLANF